MKISKKLITAIAMLTLSFVMLVTSSFAWFSMNTNVKASGMSVSAKADQLFLQIVKGTETFNSAEPQVEAVINSSKADMIPVAPAQSAINDNPITPENERKLNALEEADDVLAANSVKWFFSTSGSPDAHAAAVDFADVSGQLTEPGQKYWSINDFKIRLNPAAGLTTATKPLTCSVNITTATEDPIAKSISVLVVCGDNAILFKQGGTLNSWTKIGKKLTTNAFANPTTEPNDQGVSVKAYIFFDGENENCKTNNVKTSAYSVDISFSVSNEVA
jgi:hypothetical protein